MIVDEVERVHLRDRASADLPVGIGRVGGDRVDRAGVDQQRHHDGDAERGEQQPAADVRKPAPTEADQPDHDDRPEQVELLFDGEAPQVAKRSEVERRGVAGADPDLVPVGDVAEAGDDVAAEQTERLALEDRGVDHQQNEHEEQRRQEPPGAAQPELLQVDAAALLVLADQQQRDQVAADHEEHLDAEEATGQPAVVRVVDHHGDDGHRAHPVETRQVRQARDRLARRVPLEWARGQILRRHGRGLDVSMFVVKPDRSTTPDPGTVSGTGLRGRQRRR